MYLDKGDLIVLQSYKHAVGLNSEIESTNKINALRNAFQANDWKRLYLVNATIQVAVCHHLDDELSKQLSVATNTTIARELTGQGRLPAEQAQRTMKALLTIGKMMG